MATLTGLAPVFVLGENQVARLLRAQGHGLQPKSVYFSGLNKTTLDGGLSALVVLKALTKK